MVRHTGAEHPCFPLKIRVQVYVVFDLISKKKVPAATPWRGGGWWLGLRRVSAPVGVRPRPPPLGCAAAWGVLIAPPFGCRLKKFILETFVSSHNPYLGPCLEHCGCVPGSDERF